MASLVYGAGVASLGQSDTVCVDVIQPSSHAVGHSRMNSTVLGLAHPHGTRSCVSKPQLGTGQSRVGQPATVVVCVTVGHDAP